MVVFFMVPCVYGESKPGYAIITTTNVVEKSQKLEDFIKNKIIRGFSVFIVTEEDWASDIVNSSEYPPKGDAAANFVREWLVENYENKNLKYALLIGNPDPVQGDVPMKLLWINCDGYTDAYDVLYGDYHVPSDWFYSDLSGNWNLDGDNCFGEWKAYQENSPKEGGDLDLEHPSLSIDNIAELYVGRIPCFIENDDSLNALDKTFGSIIEFENEENIEWRNQILLGSYEFKFEKKNKDFYNKWSSGEHFANEIKTNILNNDNKFSVTTLFDDDLSDNLVFPNTWNEIEPGPALVYLQAHGTDGGVPPILVRKNLPPECDGLDDFACLSPKKPAGILLLNACSTGTPETIDNFIHRLFHANISLGVIGATRAVFLNVDDGYYSDTSNFAICMRSIEKIIKEKQTFGEALSKTKAEMNPYILKEQLSSGDWMGWRNLLAFNLYGDPSLSLDTSSSKDSIAIVKTGKEDIIIREGESAYLTPGINEFYIINNSIKVLNLKSGISIKGSQIEDFIILNQPIKDIESIEPGKKIKFKIYYNPKTLYCTPHGALDFGEYSFGNETGISFRTIVLRGATHYSDIKGTDWYSGYVDYLTGKNVIQGYEGCLYMPGNDITRAEFLKMCLLSKYGANFSPADLPNPGFMDVDPEDWFYNYIAFAKDSGFIAGYQNNTFAPNEPVIRADALKILISIFKFSEMGFEVDEELPPWTDIQDSDDCPVCSSYHDFFKEGYSVFGLFDWDVFPAQKARIVKGYDDCTFRPLKLINRAEASKMIAFAMNPILPRGGVIRYYPDDDNDGYTNKEEKMHGTDIYDADSFPVGDDDGDGATNIEEERIGTDPSDPESYPSKDSDGDGFTDVVEIKLGSNSEDSESYPLNNTCQ